MRYRQTTACAKGTTVSAVGQNYFQYVENLQTDEFSAE